jgi:hypothetical protein
MLFLFVAAFGAGFVHTFGNSATVKNIISDSGIYNSVVSSSLDQASPITGDGAQIPFSDTVMRKAAIATFTPQFIKQSTETIIDSTYRWLDGKTPLPDFYIDLTSQKTTFATSVAQSVQQQLAGLPVCTRANTPPTFDALSATCLPAGVTPSAAATSLQSDILSGQGFLDNPVITADTIKASGDSQSIFSNQLKNAPQVYHDAKTVPSILVALSTLTAIAVIFLSKTRWRGVRRVGIILLISGVLLLLSAWAANHIASSDIVKSISLNTPVLQSSVRTLVVDTAKSIGKSWWIFGAGYSALGVGLILVATFGATKNDEKTPPAEPLAEKTQKNQPDDDTPQTDKNKQPAKPAPKKTRKVIVQ